MPRRTAEPERERHEKAGFLAAHLLFRAHSDFIERFRLAFAVKIYIDRSLRRSVAFSFLGPRFDTEMLRLYRND